MFSAWRIGFVASARIVTVAAALLAGASVISQGQPLASPPLETSSGPEGHWSNLFAGWPVNAHGPTIYDPVRDRMLLFADAEIWELPFTDPLVWKQLPTPLGYGGGFLFVYDPNADRVLAVSPRSWPDSIHVSQLTLSEPMTWSEFPSVGSPASNWYPDGITFDPTTNTIVIFGGTSPDPFGGPTLIVDWTDGIGVSSGTATFYGGGSSGLVARTGFAYAVDAARSRVIVYGGSDRTRSFSDVKTAPLGATHFSTAATVGTPPPGGSAMVDPVRDRMLVFGTNAGTTEVWQLTLAAPMTWSQVATSSPAPAKSGSAIYDPGADRMVSFGAGGSDGLWTLSLASPATWTNLSLPHPSGGFGRVAVHDANSHRIVVHGDASLNDVWALSMDEPFAWSKLAPSGGPPPPRQHHTGVYDSVRDRLIIFAGHLNFGTPPYNDVWALSLGASPTWSSIVPTGTPPPGRFWHASTYDPVGDRMLVWGGYGESTYLTDLWELTLSGSPAWHLLSPVGPVPGPDQQPDAIYDPGRNRMLMISGQGETWALSLSGPLTWEHLPTCPTTNFASAYDPLLDRVVALGKDKLIYELPMATPTAWRALVTNGLGPTYISEPLMFFDAPANRAFTMPKEGWVYTYLMSFGTTLGVPRPTPNASIDLAPSVPNPASRFSTVRLSLARGQMVVLEVFDMGGRRVRELVRGQLSAGERSVRWDLEGDGGERVPPGVYFYALKVGNLRVTRRTVVVR